jgi:hypothetical protein
MLCFTSTWVTTFYHYFLGLEAPYAFSSLPVALGTAGGVAMVVGAFGLLWLNLRRHPLHGAASQRPMDRAFIALLLLIGSIGLARYGGHPDPARRASGRGDGAFPDARLRKIRARHLSKHGVASLGSGKAVKGETVDWRVN